VLSAPDLTTQIDKGCVCFHYETEVMTALSINLSAQAVWAFRSAEIYSPMTIFS